MRLILMRHGIAVARDDATCPPDPERPLTEKGRDRTRGAAEGLMQLRVSPQLILTSPYLRARETAEIVADVLGVPAERVVRTDALLPDAGTLALFDTVGTFSHKEVLCTGHAPHLDLVLAHALGFEEATPTKLKKAGAACLSMEEAGDYHGKLQWLVQAKTLRRLAA